MFSFVVPKSGWVTAVGAFPLIRAFNLRGFSCKIYNAAATTTLDLLRVR
jgi:hypothetical protein